MNHADPPRLLDTLFTSDAMREIFCDRGRLEGMLRFEAALAAAEAAAGVIPPAAVAPIQSQCRAELFDVAKLSRAAAMAGNLAIPLVHDLTGLVAVCDAAAADFVHMGATSQDAHDTGLVLQLRAAFDVIDGELSVFSKRLAELAAEHRTTPMAGRTWMQQAVPVTFGLKVAGWLSAIGRHRSRFREVRPRVLVLQLGGAAGTLAALGEKGLQVAHEMARALDLSLPDVPWHAHRDRIAEAATAIGLLAGTLGKIARDVSLLTQTEIAEVFEPVAEGRGGSSAMPQKQNPVGCAVALAAAIRIPALVSSVLTAMVQENERGLGNWHAEWETLPEICMLAAGALQHMTHVVQGLQVDRERMRENLNAAHGQIFSEAVVVALAKHVGKKEARTLVEQAVRKSTAERRELLEILAGEPKVRACLSAETLQALFAPESSVGLAGELVDRVLTNRPQ